MTDTTDTGGKMYSLAINAPQPLNITFTDGSQLIFPLSGKASFTGDVEESARVFFDAVIRHRDSQLEAERQRADDLVLHVNTQANMREKAEAEIQQCNEAGERAVKQLVLAGEEVFKLRAEIAELKAKLANPVVPVEIMSDGCILCGKSHPAGMQCPMLLATAVKE